MDEPEWLDCTDPEPMLRFLRGKLSDRKLRLFAVDCCRCVWHLLSDERSRKAVELAERYVDGFASEQEREAAEEAADQASRDAVRSRQASNYTIPEMFTIVARAARITISPEKDVDTEAGLAVVASRSLIALNQTSGLGSKEAEMAACCLTLRELVANPFRPVALDPSWRTPIVLALAQGAYEERILPAGTLEPDRLAVLADALEEAGCDNDDILSHLRGPGPHVRGCWVVDAILLKE
jgi:hypothetical protein